MMLDQRGETGGLKWSKDFADDFGVLLDDGCKRNDVDDALLTMSESMAEREAQRGKCLATTGWHSKGENSGGLIRGGSAVFNDSATLEVNGVVWSGDAKIVDSRINQPGDVAEGGVGRLIAGFRLGRVHERLSGEKIGIDEA